MGLLEKIDLKSALSAFLGRVPDVDVENGESENLGKSVCYSCVTFPLEMCDTKENREESCQVVLGVISIGLVLVYALFR